MWRTDLTRASPTWLPLLLRALPEARSLRQPRPESEYLTESGDIIAGSFCRTESAAAGSVLRHSEVTRHGAACQRPKCDVSKLFFAAVLEHARLKSYVSSDHFTVDGTLLDASEFLRRNNPAGRRASACRLSAPPEILFLTAVCLRKTPTRVERAEPTGDGNAACGAVPGELTDILT